jgi:hypothetical protein
MSSCIRLFPFAALALGLALTLPTAACYSGLTLIPTADTVGAEQYCLDLQMDGKLTSRATDTRIVNFEVGVTDRLDVGEDRDLSSGAGDQKFFNGKYVFAQGAKGGAAVGVCDVSAGETTSYYLVGTREVGDAHGHLGVIRNNGSTQWFAGTDREQSASLTLMADYFSGDDGEAALSAYYATGEHTGVLVGVQFPNGGGNAHFTLHLCITGTATRTVPSYVE